MRNIKGAEWTEVDFNHLRRSYATYIPVGGDYGWVITIAHVGVYDKLTDAVSIKVYPAERADGNIVCAFDYVKKLLYYVEKNSYPNLSDYIDLIDLSGGTLYYDVLNDDGDYSYRESLSITRNKDSLQLEVLCCNESTADVDELYHAHFVCSKVWNEDIKNYVLVPFDLMQYPRDADDMRLLTDTFKYLR